MSINCIEVKWTLPKANIQSYKILMNNCFLRQWAIMIIVYDKTTEVWKKRWRTWAMTTLWSECDINKNSGSAENMTANIATQEAPNHNEYSNTKFVV